MVRRDIEKVMSDRKSDRGRTKENPHCQDWRRRKCGKRYVIHFVHKDNVDGDIRVTIVGNNQAGFTIAFAKDSETVIDAEFKAQPMDKEGTLITYQEEMDVTAASGQ